MELPGSKEYEPALPSVSKIHLDDNNIACDVFVFVDDLRMTGPTKKECWGVAQRVTQVIDHLELQEAS